MKRYINVHWVYEPDYGYGKAMRVTESNHPRFHDGTRFDFGFLQIAVKEGYEVNIQPVPREVMQRITEAKEGK